MPLDCPHTVWGDDTALCLHCAKVPLIRALLVGRAGVLRGAAVPTRLEQLMSAIAATAPLQLVAEIVRVCRRG